jgi:hypothetical protein
LKALDLLTVTPTLATLRGELIGARLLAREAGFHWLPLSCYSGMESAATVV